MYKEVQNKSFFKVPAYMSAVCLGIQGSSESTSVDICPSHGLNSLNKFK